MRLGRKNCGAATSPYGLAHHGQGFDTELAFMVAEIQDDRMYFNAISGSGNIIDSGIIERRMPVDVGSDANTVEDQAAP